MATLPQTFIETLVVSLGRASLFYACRHYLLRSLYHDLRSLSSSPPLNTYILPTPTTSVPHESDTELGELPQPATMPRTPSEVNALPAQPRLKGTWHSSLARITFSLCFSESCILFLLVLAQAINVLSPRARYINWQLSLGLLVSAILLVAPLLQCVLLTHPVHAEGLPNQTSFQVGSHLSRRSFSLRFILTGAPYCIYLLVLSYIPLPSGLKTQEFTSAILSRLVVLGTIILGLLAGFGAASTVLTYFQLSIASRDAISDSQVAAAEQALSRVRNDLFERQGQLDRNSVNESESSFLSRLNPFSVNPELSSLRREIQGLEALEFQMSKNLEFLQRRRAISRYSSTLSGRLWGWVGTLFALYCAFRVAGSVINLVSPSSPETPGSVSTPTSSDLITYLLALSVSFVLPASDVDVAAASKQLSLFLVGAIILSSVRRALQGVARALKLTSKNLVASLLMLVLAQLVGIYMLSTLIQMRTSFPATPDSEGHINLFETLPEYHVFGTLWDGAFLASVIVSGGVRWLDERVNGPSLG